MNDAPRPACVPAGHITPLVPAPPWGDRREPVAGRLARIERAAALGHDPWWDRDEACRDLRDLLAVAKAAREVLASLMWDPSRHHELGSARVCNTCGRSWPCDVAHLRAALANLEGGA